MPTPQDSSPPPSIIAGILLVEIMPQVFDVIDAFEEAPEMLHKMRQHVIDAKANGEDHFCGPDCQCTNIKLGFLTFIETQLNIRKGTPSTPWAQ